MSAEPFYGIYIPVKTMRDNRKHDAIVIIGCRRDQVLEIIEHVKTRFPDVEVSYEVLHEEIL